MNERIVMTAPLPFLRRERDWSLSHRRPLTVADDANNLRQTIKRGESFLTGGEDEAGRKTVNSFMAMPASIGRAFVGSI
jgi:hypothetical protein